MPDLAKTIIKKGQDQAVPFVSYQTRTGISKAKNSLILPYELSNILRIPRMLLTLAAIGC